MFSNIIEIYNELESLADPVVKKWFLMNSMWYPVMIVLTYLFIIFLLGPKLMKNRKAFNINKVILIYNISQVIFNGYLCKVATSLLLQDIRSFRCLKIYPADTEFGYNQRAMHWLLMLNKTMDLLDTIFFVMKKKQAHLTFLHVYHHILTFVMGWVIPRYFPGGQVIVLVILNTFVHSVMYAYYSLSLMNQFKKTVDFVKKYITQIQITQFVIAGMHATYGMTDPTCDYSRILVYFGLTQCLLMIVLFVNFYRKSYTSKSRRTNYQLQNESLKNELTKKSH